MRKVPGESIENLMKLFGKGDLAEHLVAGKLKILLSSLAKYGDDNRIDIVVNAPLDKYSFLEPLVKELTKFKVTKKGL